MASPLLDYYRSLDSEAALQQLIGTAKEDVHIEFKQKKDGSHGKLDVKDGRQFSRALSGFANSDGGVLLFGIETDKNDVASGLKPIAEVDAFAVALKKSILNSTMPVVDDVQIGVIAAALEDAGYVKCLIPKSDKAPHRAMLADREYYKRTTDGFYRLEHFDLEDMFGRRPHPSLQMHLSFRSHTPSKVGFPLKFGFINAGRGIAKHYGFVCRFFDGVSVLGAAEIRDMSPENEGSPVVAFQDDRSVVHANGITRFVGEAFLEADQEIEFKLTWFCEGMAPRSATGRIAIGQQLTVTGN